MYYSKHEQCSYFIIKTKFNSYIGFEDIVLCIKMKAITQKIAFKMKKNKTDG